MPSKTKTPDKYDVFFAVRKVAHADPTEGNRAALAGQYVALGTAVYPNDLDLLRNVPGYKLVNDYSVVRA